MQALNLKSVPVDSLTVLAVDDEYFNLEILSEWLLELGCKVDTAEHGKQAVELLSNSSYGYNLVLLDRMMPQMDGLEVMAYMRTVPTLRYTPVILQTAAATLADIQSGLDAGVYYYLTKPFNQATLSKMIQAAVSDAQIHTQLRSQVQEQTPVSLSQQSFSFRTLEEVQQLALRLASISSQPQRAVVGLYELMLNAIEHGNLNISYDEKTQFLASGTWLDEIRGRLQLAEFERKVANISVERGHNQVAYRISDQGGGFDYSTYLNILPARVEDSHGRGIAFANQQCFDSLEYSDGGRQVVATLGALESL
ncbi:response regulator [Kaarinaea lacus]